MAFDLANLLEFCVAAIRDFAAEHQEEDFYAFAIDGGFLCLNSEQEFARTLKECQDEWDHKLRPVARWEDLSEDEIASSQWLLDLHQVDKSNQTACLAAINESRFRNRESGFPCRNPDGIQELRDNPGDWAYQGFADMLECDGFDKAAYEQHWYMSDEEQKISEYGKAMDLLVERLRTSGVFDHVKTVPDFYVCRVEHNY